MLTGFILYLPMAAVFVLKLCSASLKNRGSAISQESWQCNFSRIVAHRGIIIHLKLRREVFTQKKPVAEQNRHWRFLVFLFFFVLNFKLGNCNQSLHHN